MTMTLLLLLAHADVAVAVAVAASLLLLCCCSRSPSPCLGSAPQNGDGCVGSCESLTQSCVASTTPCSLPGVPTAISTHAGYGEITLSWARPVDDSDGACRVLGYLVAIQVRCFRRSCSAALSAAYCPRASDAAIGSL
jgi:hypothetical protein